MKTLNQALPPTANRPFAALFAMNPLALARAVAELGLVRRFQ